MDSESSTAVPRPSQTHEALPFKGLKAFKQRGIVPTAIPRYLYHTMGPASMTHVTKTVKPNEVWIRSQDAAEWKENSMMDLFDRSDVEAVAEMIHRHSSSGMGVGKDNLVPWTSSLVTALVIVSRIRAKHDADRDEVGLAIIDTTAFPPDTFICNKDLIHGFAKHKDSLRSLGGIDQGMYVHQGALRIDGRCDVISLDDMERKGLSALWSGKSGVLVWGEGEEIDRRRVKFRRASTISELPTTTQEELNAANAIAALFREQFKLPTAAALLALSPRRRSDSAIVGFFRPPTFSGALDQVCPS